jgi:hypothetical protein
LTASDVGADASGTANSAISTHNNNTSAHADIRQEISALSSEIADIKWEIPIRGTHYWTEADQEAIVQQVITALGTPVFGRVDADNNIILTGELADGTYTIKYEDAEGNVTVVGQINFAKSGADLIVWKIGYTLDGTTGAMSTAPFTWGGIAQATHVSEPMQIVAGRTYRIETANANSTNMYIYYYKEDDTYISRTQLWDIRSTGVNESATPQNIVLNMPSGTGIIRFRGMAYTTTNQTSNMNTIHKPVLAWEV